MPGDSGKSFGSSSGGSCEGGQVGVAGGLEIEGRNSEKEKLGREILYRSMLKELSLQMREKQIKREIILKRDFMISVMAKGGKLANRIRRESGAHLQIIQSSEASKGVVLRGHAEMVNKAELMLKEISSSAVEISVSDEEREVLLSGGGKKKGCILEKIRQRISVPIRLQGSR